MADTGNTNMVCVRCKYTFLNNYLNDLIDYKFQNFKNPFVEILFYSL